MKSFHYTNRETLTKEIVSTTHLVNDLDFQIKKIMDTVSRDDWKETESKINEMRTLSKERDTHIKKLKQLHKKIEIIKRTIKTNGVIL